MDTSLIDVIAAEFVKVDWESRLSALTETGRASHEWGGDELKQKSDELMLTSE